MAQVTNGDIRTRIKDMIETNVSFFSSGTGQVFEQAIMLAPRANLPILIITDGNGTYDRTSLGERFVKPNMIFNLSLLMQEWTPEYTLNLSSAQIDTLTQELEDMFSLYYPLIHNGSSLKGVRDTFLTSVTGVSPRPYPNVQGAPIFVSKQWQLNIIYTRKV